MMKKTAIMAIILLMCGQVLPFCIAENSVNEPGPEFEVGLATCISIHGPEISVKNIGDAIAHNVKLIDLTIQGFVVYNNRVTSFRDEVEPGHTAFSYPNSLFVGFGIFRATMTVTCDEGVTGTGSGNGIIFGPLIFVP